MHTLKISKTLREKFNRKGFYNQGKCYNCSIIALGGEIKSYWTREFAQSNKSEGILLQSHSEKLQFEFIFELIRISSHGQVPK